MLIEDAIVAYRDALVERAAEQRAAWADAEAQTRQAFRLRQGAG